MRSHMRASKSWRRDQNMKRHEIVGRIRPRGISCATVIGWLLVPAILIILLEFNYRTSATLRLQLYCNSCLPLSTMEESSNPVQQGGEISLPISLTEEQGQTEKIVGKKHSKETSHVAGEEIATEGKGKNNSTDAGLLMPTSTSDMKEQSEEKLVLSADPREMLGENEMQKKTEVMQLPHGSDEKREQDPIVSDAEAMQLSHISDERHEQYPMVSVHTETEVLPVSQVSDEMDEQYRAISDGEVIHVSHDSDEKHEQHTAVSDVPIQKNNMICDFSQPRSDTCSMDGDVRVLSIFSTIIAVSPSPLPSEETIFKIRPYARKWEESMGFIKELTVKSSFDHGQIPSCNVKHEVPAIVFSTGGFLGNFFHDFTDVLIPLFVTARQYNAEVQFLVVNMNWPWIFKYQSILTRLSRYPIINLDADNLVHCFPYVHVGLKSHKVMGIDPSMTPNGYTMADFREFIRTSLSLKRAYVNPINKNSRRKPRLLIMLRKGSRSFTNEREVVAMAKRIGYKVITAGPQDTKDLPRFADIVNSCDVMMGVHGAGLANMVFLPTNATLIQIIPWGDMTWACRHDFGEPAPDMGIKYLEYEIMKEESSLIKRYPRDHPVFKDPASIHKHGWMAIWNVFLNQQKVKLDVDRFSGVLSEVLQSIKQ
ncbi:beta-1,2-xylosyltransferase XYXT1-like isoform X1 [Typha latifolia]|uniref:beta-1,2-xylosyltransferase XYXT1-like isoform X1 n=1 Tax=Typha latifolia TaxID=4733 RepID=UPI003C305DA1